MYHIIFPTDFSENASNAFYYALNIASQINARISILHVQSPSVTLHSIEDIDTFTEIQKQLCEKEFDKMTSQAKEMNDRGQISSIKIETYSKIGDVVSCTNTLAKEIGATMVIMGTKGAGNAMERVFGSITNAMIDASPMPVLAIPENCKYNRISHITYASDLKASDNRVLENVLRLGLLLSAKVHFVHIHNSPELVEKSIMEDIKNDFKDKVRMGYLDFELLESGNLQDRLDQYLTDESSDLLVMTTTKRNFLEKLTSQSQTKKYSFHSKIGLLAYH